MTVSAALLLTTAATGATAQDKAPPKGGTAVIGEWQAADQLNLYFTTALANVEATSPANHPLITIDNAGNWVPDLAVEVPSVENGGLVPDADGDGFTLNVKLKPGLGWSDGTPMTMNDWKFTYDWAVDTAINGPACSGCGIMVPLVDAALASDPEVAPADAYAPANQMVESITVSEDGLTMTVVWKRNYAGWLGWLSQMILPQHFWKDIPVDGKLAAMAVGPDLVKVPANGPFKIVSAGTQGIDYERNEYWKATDGPYLDKLRLQFYGTKDGMITDFLAGNVDLALNMTQADYPAVANVDKKIGRADLDSVWQYEHLDLNTSSPALSDIKVRTAIAMAIDKKGISAVLFPGVDLEPACSPAPPGTWWRIDTTCPPFDPAGAAALLDETGWILNESGRRVKDSDGDGTPDDPEVPLRLKMCTTSGNPTRLTTLGRINQDLLTNLGIPTDIQTADGPSQYFAGWASTTPETDCSIYRGTYDIALFTWILGGDPYSNYYYIYHSSQIPSDDNPNGSNDTRISDPELDAALDAVGTEIDLVKLKAALATVQEEWAAAIAEIPLYYRAETTGVSRRLGGFEKYNPSSAGATWDTERWFIKKGKKG